MPRMFACVWLLLISSLSHAGWLKTEKEIRVELNDIVPLTLDSDADEVKYVFAGKSAKGFREYDPDPKRVLLQILGRSEGTSYLFITGQKGGKLLSPEVVVIIVGNPAPPTPPGPLPPVPPVPPPVPDNPELAAFADKIKTAASVDQWDPERLTQLSTGHYAAADAIVPDTYSKVRAVITAKLQRSLDGVAISPSVKPLLKDSLDSVFAPHPDTYVMTNAEIKVIQSRLRYIGKALEIAAK